MEEYNFTSQRFQQPQMCHVIKKPDPTSFPNPVDVTFIK